MAFSYKAQKPGDIIQSTDWNNAMQAIVELNSDKVNRSGNDTIAGPLTIKGTLSVATINEAALNFQTNGVSRLTIINNGNVGIGTTDPENGEGWNKVLDILGYTHAKLSVRTANIDGRFLVHDAGFWSSPAGMILGTKTNHALSFGTNGNTRMTILNNGNVGIGTTPDTVNNYWKQVLDISGSTNAKLSLKTRSNTNIEGRFQVDESSCWGAPAGMLLGTVTDHALNFGTKGSTHMTILSSGNVGIGTTNPGAKLDVNGNLKVQGDVTVTGVMSGAANGYQKAQFIMSGGGVVTWSGTSTGSGPTPMMSGRLKWTQRFIAMSMEKSTYFSAGHINIFPPISQIPATQVHDGNPRSASEADGVVLNGWEALYAVHTVRGDQNAVSFNIVYYTKDFVAPSNWLLVAVVNNDDNTVKLGTGAIIKASGSYSVNGNFTVESKVGIGTTNPQAKLEVNGNLSVTSGSLSFGSRNGQLLNLYSTNHGIGAQSNTLYFRTGQNFAWYKGGSHNDTALNAGTNGTALMTLTPDTSQTTHPAKLHVVGDLVLGKDEKNTKFLFHSRKDDSGDFLLITNDKDDGNWDWSQGIALRRGGNVGIGTNSPQAKLDVNGNLKVQGDVTVTGNVNGRNISADGTKLDNHVNNKNNPHGVTAAQVGALPLSGGNVTGNLEVGGSLRFGNRNGQLLNLYSTNHGIGAQSNTLYFRTGQNFAWYKGGSHNDTALNAGTNGTALMTLTPDTSQTTHPAKLHVVGDLVLGKDEKNTKFLFHSRKDDSGDFLLITNDKDDGNWDWSQGIALRRGGNVGIGTNSPQAKLDVNGNLKVQGDVTVTGNVNGRNISADGTKLDNHVNNKNNPHGVTAAQVGALPLSGGNVNGSVNVSANVGIGTNNPTKAKVQIEGYQAYKQLDGYSFLVKKTTTDRTGYAWASDQALSYSLYASDRIIASECHVFSDERIKEIYNRSDSQEDLKTLLQIEVTDYSYRDKIAKGNGQHKKVIGQQIAKVFPQAVSTNTDVVCDIFQFATLSDGWVTLTNHGLKTGERVKLIWGEDKSQIFTIEAVTPDTFQIDLDYCGDILVYGREVNDFHVVDYDALSMLHISATQALYQIISKLQQEVETLKQQSVLSVL